MKLSWTAVILSIDKVQVETKYFTKNYGVVKAIL